MNVPSESAVRSVLRGLGAGVVAGYFAVISAPHGRTCGPLIVFASMSIEPAR